MCNTTCNGSEFVNLPAGSNGNDGIFGGYSMPFLFETVTSTPPTAQSFRFNNVTYSSVTNIYFSHTNNDAVSSTDFLTSFIGSTNFGVIRLFKEFDSSIYADYDVISVTNSGAYHTIGVAYKAGNGLFISGDNVVTTFSINGDNGTNGTNALNYQGTSTTSINLSTLGATTSVTISPVATAFQIGSRIRVASTVSPTTDYFEGVISTYNTGTGVISLAGIDNIVGTATIAAWTISLAGDKGDTGSDAVLPVGVILDYSATTPPTGWLFCNGAAVSRTTYATLFTLVSTTYGAGDGATTFNLPDLQKRIRIGYDPATVNNATPSTPGEENYGGLNNKGGNAGVSLIKTNLPQHKHTVNTTTTDTGTVVATSTSATSVVSVPAGATLGLSDTSSFTGDSTVVTVTTTLSGSSGNGATDGLLATPVIVENRTKYIVLYPIIKY